MTSFAVIHRCISKREDGPLSWGPGLSGKGKKENAGEDSVVAGSQLAGASVRSWKENVPFAGTAELS